MNQNNIIKIIKNDKDYRTKIEELLNLPKITQQTKITFALYCAKQSFKYIDSDKYPELHNKTSKVLELVGDWILGKKVSKKDLDAAVYAANAAVYAATAAANAANAAVYAANAAVYAANAAVYAANAAVYAAANAAVYATIYEQEMKKLYRHTITLVIKEYNLDNTIKVLYG